MMHDIRSQPAQERIDDKPEVVLATIPQETNETMLEVTMICETSGATIIELRSLVWGEGLGWYRQHTLRLNGTTARNLIQALGVAQRRVECQTSDILGPKVLPFPRHHLSDGATTGHMPLSLDFPNISELEVVSK
jgi:hypothetical protein